MSYHQDSQHADSKRKCWEPGEEFFLVVVGAVVKSQGRLLKRGRIQVGLREWTGFQQAEAGYAGGILEAQGDWAKEGRL